MAAWIGAAVAGASLLGSFVGGKKQNQANRLAAHEQMAFQERMSSSAYQRSMADMRKAVLNPILAYKQGGASTPTGQTYQAQNVLGTAVKAGADTYQMTNSAANLRANTQKTLADARMAQLDADKKAAGGDNVLISSAIDADRAADALKKRIKVKKKSRRGVKTQKVGPPGKRTVAPMTPWEKFLQRQKPSADNMKSRKAERRRQQLKWEQRPRY